MHLSYKHENSKFKIRHYFLEEGGTNIRSINVQLEKYKTIPVVKTKDLIQCWKQVFSCLPKKLYIFLNNELFMGSTNQFQIPEFWIMFSPWEFNLDGKNDPRLILVLIWTYKWQELKKKFYQIKRNQQKQLGNFEMRNLK